MKTGIRKKIQHKVANKRFKILEESIFLYKKKEEKDKNEIVILFEVDFILHIYNSHKN